MNNLILSTIKKLLGESNGFIRLTSTEDYLKLKVQSLEEFQEFLDSRIDELLRAKEFLKTKELLEAKELLIESNIETWRNDSKIVFLKNYIDFRHLISSWPDDQAAAFSFLNELPRKFKNNSYLLLVVDTVDNLSSNLLLQINKVEKNSDICRKYVINSLNDLEKIPFFQMKKWGEINNLEVTDEFLSYFTSIDKGSFTQHIVKNYFSNKNE
ncbi:ABC-three component system middle component 1 [Priestia megaterium]